eukprot:Skav228687  [mRNA]  locus=scaffold2247:155011:155526:- [translate_table: standard]
MASESLDKTVVTEQDLVKEKCLLLKLSHPSVLTCFGLVTLDSGTLGLVLELCEGGHLLKWLRENPLGSEPPPDLLHRREQMFLQVAAGLHHIHTRRVLHLDVKTNNCLLCASGTVKISDFGMAAKFSKSYEGVIAYGQSVYNSNYRPPECDVSRKAKAGKCIVCVSAFVWT